MKNGILVSQQKFVCFRLVFFQVSWDLKLLFAQNFWIFLKKEFFLICCNTALSLIWNFVDQILLRIEWENGILKLFQEKNNFGDYCFSHTKKLCLQNQWEFSKNIHLNLNISIWTCINFDHLLDLLCCLAICLISLNSNFVVTK